jgi:hypothetical protein
VHNAPLPNVPYALGITPYFLKGVETREEYNSLSLQPRDMPVMAFEIFSNVYPPSHPSKAYDLPPFMVIDHERVLIQVDRLIPAKAFEYSNSRPKGFSVTRGQGDPWSMM